MGHQAVVLMNVDLVHLLPTEPDLGQRICRAVSECAGRGHSVNVGSTGITICQVHHADFPRLLISENLRLAAPGSGLHDDRLVEQLLRDAADKLGFTLRRKSKKE